MYTELEYGAICRAKVTSSILHLCYLKLSICFKNKLLLCTDTFKNSNLKPTKIGDLPNLPNPHWLQACIGFSPLSQKVLDLSLSSSCDYFYHWSYPLYHITVSMYIENGECKILLFHLIKIWIKWISAYVFLLNCESFPWIIYMA